MEEKRFQGVTISLAPVNEVPETLMILSASARHSNLRALPGLR